MALALVLMYVCMGMAAISVLAATTFCHMTLSNRNDANVHARHAAESTAAAVIEHIMATATKTPSPVLSSENLQWSQFSAPAHGLTATYGGAAVPASINNLTKDTSCKGPFGGIPPYSADVVAMGICGDAVAEVEATLRLPPYPYVIASSGPLYSDSGLFVAGLADATHLQADVTQIDPKYLLPADMASNSKQAFFAVQAAPTTFVSGNVDACGGIRVPDASIGGGVFPNGEAVDIPNIDVGSYAPSWDKIMSYLDAQSGPATIEGYVVAGGGCVVNGNLKLDSAVLYCQTDLTVHGAVMGNGAIICTGRVTIDNGQQPSDLTSNNVVALLSSGNVQLSGNGPSNSCFRGLVWTSGDFSASNITLMGSLLAHAHADGTPSQTVLHHVAALYVPDYTSSSLQVPLPAPPPPPPSGTTQGLTLTYQLVKYSGALDSLGNPVWAGEPALLVISNDPRLTYAVSPNPPFTVSFFDGDPGVSAPYAPNYTVNGTQVIPSYTIDSSGNLTFTQSAEAAALAFAMGIINNYDGVGYPYYSSSGVAGFTHQTKPPSQAAPLMPAEMANILPQATATAGGSSGGNSGGGGGGTEGFAFDLNQFIGGANRMRLYQWREF